MASGGGRFSIWASTYFGCRLLLVQSDSSSTLLPPRNLHKSPYFMPRPQAFGFSNSYSSCLGCGGYGSLFLRFPVKFVFGRIVLAYLVSTIAGCASLGFLLRRWQSGGRKTEKVGRGCSMHEMKWTELHIHKLFYSFDCVANAFYRSSLGWTKMGFFFWCGCWE